MGLRDITGVFSRYFIVGYFLPSFFLLAILKVALTDGLLPKGVQVDDAAAFGVVGAIALLAGLLLLGLRVPLLRMLSGYFLRAEGPAARPLRLVERSRQRQLAAYDRLLQEARPRPDG